MADIMNMICREHVIVLVKQFGSEELLRKIEKLPSFPVPNPSEENGRNIMGQTEKEFWELVDKQYG